MRKANQTSLRSADRNKVQNVAFIRSNTSDIHAPMTVAKIAQAL